tara:strand:+ start:20978 stop:21757 length:780 start_codon:yes stop_codon:yes gene_type:complete
MSFELADIKKGVENKAPRIILLGVEKVGKSTFASEADNPIFLPIAGEEGIDGLDVAKFPPAEKIEDVFEAMTTIIKEEHDHKTFVIDSVSALEPVIWRGLCREGNVQTIEEYDKGWGKGYVAAVNKWHELMAGFDMIRKKSISIILIGHVKVKRFDDPLGLSFDQYQFDVHEKVNLALQRWADCILFANSETTVRKEEIAHKKEKNIGMDLSGKHYLYTQKRPGHPGGGRGVYGQLPYKMDFKWEVFSKAVSEAAQTNK